MGRKSKYETITINCPTCGKEFSFKENRKRRYCSRECKYRAQRGELITA